MDIKLQAELRRKKILANSEARLKKITSRLPEKTTISEAPDEDELKVQSSNGACNGICSSSNQPSVSQAEQTDVLSVPELDNIKEEPEFWTRNTELFSKISDVPTPSPLNAEQKKHQPINFEHYCFLALGIIVNICIYFGLSWLFLENVIGPFIVACIPRLPTIFRREAQLTGIFSLFTFLEHSQKLILPIKIFVALRSIAQLFALYMFSFTISCCIVCNKSS